MIQRTKIYFTQHPHRWLLYMLVVPLLVSVIFVKVTGSAGAENRVCTHNIEVCKTPHQMVRLFESGKLGHADGFRFAAYFAHPGHARTLLTHRVESKIEHLSPAQQRHLRSRLNSRGLCSISCMAGKIVGNLTHSATCVLYGPASLTTSYCHLPGTKPLISNQAFDRGIGVTLCGAAVAFGVVTAPESAGASTVAVGAAIGASGCTWGFFHGL